MGHYGFPKYVSVGEKKAKALKKLAKLKKKNPNIQPVVIQGQALAKTWWGRSWNNNLELYADYSNRIGRGRSYVRHHCVLDLKILSGRVEAVVAGSGARPYRVEIQIKPISKTTWAAVKKSCKGRLDSLKSLLAGKFPKDLATLFTQEKAGLFPTPKEIRFNCSCPDWADMCKHVAASLYGIGARLDEDPMLFFALRQVDVNDLLTQTAKEGKQDLLAKAKKKTSRVIDTGAGLSDMFGIDLGAEGDLDSLKPRQARKGTQLKKDKKSAIDQMDEMIGRHEKKGVSVSELINVSGFGPQKVRNLLFRLKGQGRIESVSRGVYRTAG